MEEEKKELQNTVEQAPNEGYTPRVQMLNYIDQGTYGVVWRARMIEKSDALEPSKNMLVAIKIEQKDTKKDFDLENEFKTMKSIGKHENLIEYKEFVLEFQTEED